MSDAAFVYVITCDGRTKIGLADNVEKRLSGIRHAVGSEVTLHGCREFPTRPTAAAAERLLHKQFQASRLLGEWFSAAAADCVEALNVLVIETIEVSRIEAGVPEPQAPRSEFIYETALAMAEGRATQEQINQAMLLINA